MARLRLLRPLRKVAGRSASALIQFAWPSANPFFARALRTDSRRHILVYGVATIALVYAVIVALLLRFGSQLLDYRPSNFYSLRHMPAWAGGNVIGLAALLLAGLSGYLVHILCSARVAQLLERELSSSTLVALQTLPLREERWLWQISAQPAAMGLVLGLAGLPLYLLAYFCGFWSLCDIAGLLLLFTLLGYTTPQWQPLQWATTKYDNRVGVLQKQKIQRAQSQGIERWSMSARQRLELNRRVQRALADETAAPTLAEVTETEESALIKTKKPSTATTTGEKSPATGQAWFATNDRSPWPGLNLYFFVFFSLVNIIGVGRAGRFWHALGVDLPRNVSDLLPSILLSWPLIAARLMWAPLPFLAFHLPPIVLAVPLVVLVNLQRNLNLASQVSAAESFWTLRRARSLTAYSRWLWALAVPALLGYFWNATITMGLAAYLLPGAPPTSDAALAALWTVFITAAALAGSSLLREPFKAAVRGDTSFTRSWHSAFSKVGHLSAITFSSYFVLCWLGGYSGVGPLWQQRLVPTLCSFGAFCLASLACSALAAALQPRARKLWIRAVIFWFGYGPLLALACLIFGDNGWPLNMSAPLIAASPLMSLYSFFRFNLDSPGGVSWWLGPLVQAVVATLALGLAGTVLWQSSDSSSNQARHPLAAVGRVLWFTLRCFYRVFGSFRCRPKTMPLRYVLRPIARVWGHLRAALARFDNAIAQRGIAFDNALLTADLRSRLRRGGWCAQWLGWQLLAIGIWLINSHPWNIGTAPAARLEWAHSVTFFAVAASACVIFIYMTVVLAVSSSRARGALMAAFITPMSDEAILVGKLAPSLLRGFGPFCSLAVPLLSAIYVRFTVADYAPLWLGLCCLLLVYATLLCRAAWQLATALPGKRTSANNKGALFKISLQFFLLAAFIILASTYGYPVGVALVLLGSMAAVVLGTAQYIWRAVIRSSASHRYGDVKAYGNRFG